MFIKIKPVNQQVEITINTDNIATIHYYRSSECVITMVNGNKLALGKDAYLELCKVVDETVQKC